MPAPRRRIPRLFLERDLDGDRLTLDEREAHYLGNVLRLKRGDPLVAFNGRGTERHASIATLQRRGGELELGSKITPLPAAPLELTLLQALAKNDAMDLIVQKTTELGVRAIQPVYTEFSVVKLDDERVERRVDHWRKIARSACEQCGRHEPPEIGVPMPLAAAVRALPPADMRLALEPFAAERLDRSITPPSSIVVAIGPEGGFGTEDMHTLDGAGFTRVIFGPRVLRTETAAIAACAAMQSLWGDW